MDPALIEEYIFLCPWEESIVLNNILPHLELPASSAARSRARPALVRAVPDHEALGVPREALQRLKPHPYKLQMYLKLAVSALLRSSHYLVLDSDVLLLQRLTPATAHWLFPQPGKSVYSEARVGAHMDWWEKTAASLGLAAQVPADPAALHMGITPQLLSTEIARRTVEFMDARFGGHVASLARLLTAWGPFFTEYVAYALVARHLGLFERHHAPKRAGAPSLSRGYFRSSAKKLATSRLEPGRDCIFLVVQSNLGVPERRVVSDLQDVFLRGANVTQGVPI